MPFTTRAVQKLVDEQCRKWSLSVEPPEPGPVITVSREAGSIGRDLAIRLADELGFVLSGRSIITAVAENTKMSEAVIRSLDESGRTWVQNLIGTMVGMDSDTYFGHLAKVIGALGRHGNSVIVGRGANLILPAKRSLRVRVIAPLEQRVAAVAEHQKITKDAARSQIQAVEAGRRAFIRQHFQKDINDVLCYDIVINSEFLGLDAAVELVRLATVDKYGTSSLSRK